MTVNDHLGRFHGLPIHDFTPTGDPRRLPKPGDAAWRLSVEYDAEQGFPELWRSLLDTVDPAGIRAVVIGPWWSGDYSPVDTVIATITGDAERLPALEAVFLADVTYDECEISWLTLGDVTPLLTTFPGLTELAVRGGMDLVLKPVQHEKLTALRFESGGLPAEVVRAVGGSELPALERLTFWLGVGEYGGDATLDDLAPFLDGARFPALRHLGLANSELQDEIAAAVAHAPVVARLRTLDLSMGVLSDEGAAALLEGQPLTHLEILDLHHHYLSEEMQQRLTDALPDVVVDLGEPEEADEDDDRYVAVAE
ncbi:STM4015 family protein [Kitasatospora sp. NPDC097643]|uniref:STM4015 family protein n=1 Tax=Kitasatospora sp. NPDC097643 TaxID=3157230 RepID=UPI0033268155